MITPAAHHPRATLPRVTPLSSLVRAAREAAVPTPAELQARVGRPGPAVVSGLSHAELAARCNAVLERRGERATVHRESLVRAERVGPREPLLGLICDALGLDVQFVAVAPARRSRIATTPSKKAAR